MGFKRSAERMSEIEADLRLGMGKKGIVGDAQEEIVAGIKSFALYGFPESHAASFALIAYASAYLKAHHPAAFLCALLNNWPMGFYHPAALISDASRHYVVTLPVDVQSSDWLCTLQPRLGDDLSVRLGLKYVTGLREAVATRLMTERASAPFRSVADLHARVGLNQSEMGTLADIGAFTSFGRTRREALWQVEALGRSGALFARVDPDGDSDFPSPLPPMDPHEEMVADFRGTHVTTGPHPIAMVRPLLEREGITTSAGLAAKRDGDSVRIAGVVIVRQRPGTAKGFVFITLEDETGFTNALVTPNLFERWRPVILAHPALVIEGKLQKHEGVILIAAKSFSPLRDLRAADISHDFH